MDWQAPPSIMRMPWPARAPAKPSSDMPSGSGMTAATLMAGGAADEDVDAQRLAAADGGGMMDADAAMDLVVQTDFLVGPVLAAGELDAVHAQVRAAESGRVGIFGIDQRQGDEGAAVVGPGLKARQGVDRDCLLPTRAHCARNGVTCGPAPAAGAIAATAGARREAGRPRNSTSRRTASSVSRKMNRMRAIVPNRLLAIGNRQPLTRAK